MVTDLETLDASTRVTRARELTTEQIAACVAACGGDIDQAWRQLRVSKRSLKLRMQEVGL